MTLIYLLLFIYVCVVGVGLFACYNARMRQGCEMVHGLPFINSHVRYVNITTIIINNIYIYIIISIYNN